MKKITLGFLGCGNIGGHVYRLLEDMRADLERQEGLSISLKKALVKSMDEAATCAAPAELLTTDPNDIFSDPEISIVCEFMGGEHPAADFMLRALESGKTVVTANKVALALNWHTLQAAAEAHGVGLYFEASVCGAIPVINVLQHSMQANRIDSLMGIINGTTNYILSRMYLEGGDYADVLADAQRLGLAEPNPTADVEGFDAAYKLSILSSLAFHGRVTFGQIHREGITGITAVDIEAGKELGYVPKLLAIAKKNGNRVEVRVHPTFLPTSHPLAHVNGSLNAVYLYGHSCEDIVLQGRGAGSPTASAIVSDIITAAHAERPMYPTFANTAEPCADFVFDDNWMTRCFIRLSVTDAPGALAAVTAAFAAEDVSIAAVMQKEKDVDDRTTVTFITHQAYEKSIRAALARLDSGICRVENVIRIEK